MRTKEEWLEMWHLSGEEGEKAWAEKQRMNGNEVTSNHYVRDDYKPYQSMVTGELIEGRKAHREHLRKHNLVEAADIKPSMPVPKKDNLKEQIAREVYNKLRY